MEQSKKPVLPAQVSVNQDQDHKNIVIGNQKSELTNEYLIRMKTFLDCIDYKRPAFKNHQGLIARQKEQKLKLHLKAKYQSNNREVIVLNAKWGAFDIDIKILNIEGQNIKHGIEIGFGAFGSIYKGELNQRQFVIKCIPVKTSESRFKAIKQFILLKISSLLGVGPTLNSYFGFDMLMFSECIQFGMELCKKVDKETMNPHLLYQNLALLHKMNFVHQDIKPENIMYSSQRNRLVFIDFGLSQLIKQQIGSKTFTRFTGSINQCGPQMRSCYTLKAKRNVDLYYNDLYCLERSIKQIEQELQATDYVEQYQQFYTNQQLSLNFMNEFLLKLYLFEDRAKQFITLWNSQVIQNDRNYYITKMLFFYQQLIPTPELRIILQYIVTNTHTDTEIYSKIKILYEISKKNLCQSQVFKRQEKYQYFSSIFNDFFQHGLDQYNNKEKIQKELLSKNKLKGLSFLKYLSKYLEYISYTNNRYKTSAKDRQKVALVYYSLYINDKDPQTGRKLIIKTILHGLEICLKQYNQDFNSFELVMLFFKIYDFLFILDIGSSSQFIKYIETILQHKGLNKVYKFLFVARINLTNCLSQFRFTQKEGHPRVQFINSLNKWTEQKRIQYKVQIGQHDLQFDFLVEFGFETIAFYQISQESRNPHTMNIYASKLISLFYELRNKQNRSKKIYYFFAVLFRCSYFARDNNIFCKQILNIFQNNFQDDELLSQFSFDFCSNQAFKHINPIKVQAVTQLDIEKINTFLSKVANEDIILLKHVLLPLCQSLKLQELRKGANIQGLCKADGLYVRLFQSLKALLQQRYFRPDIHKCIDSHQLLNFYSMADLLPHPRIEQISQLVSQLCKRFLLECQQCHQVTINYLSLFEMKTYYIQYQHSCQKKCGAIPSQQFVNKFFSIYQKLLILASKPRLMESDEIILRMTLDYGQRICWIDEQIQAKYHGILNYYQQWVLKYNDVESYFANYLLNIRLFRIIKLLEETNYTEFIRLIFMISSFIQSSLQKSHYFKVNYVLKFILAKYTNQKLQFLFQNLKYNSKGQSKYVSLFYGIILSFSKSHSLDRQLLIAIYKDIEQIHYYFRKQIGISIYIKWLCKEQVLAYKRRWRNCNNRLLKYMIAQNMTVPVKRKTKSVNIFKQLLKKKIARFEVCKTFEPNISFICKVKDKYLQTFRMK